MFKTLGSRKHVKHQSYFFIMPSEGSSESKGVSRERGSEYTSLPVTVLPRDKTHRVYIDTYQSRCFIGIGSCCSRDWEVPQSDLLSAGWRSRKASAWFSLSQICWNLGGGWRRWSKAQEPGEPKSLEQEMWAFQLKLGVNLLSLCLSVQLRSWTIGWCLTLLVRTVFLMQSADASLISSDDALTDTHAKVMFYCLSEHLLSPVKWTYIVSHHRTQRNWKQGLQQMLVCPYSWHYSW